MGTVNYMTSKYITLGIKPIDAWDIEQDESAMEEMKEVAAEYNRTVEETIDQYISDIMEADYSNIEYILKKYSFRFFNVTIESGYYEGFSLNIEPDFDFYTIEDKRNAQKETTQLKKMLIECAGCGLVEVWPGWCTKYQDYTTTIKSISEAIKEVRQDIKTTETWWTHYHKRTA